MLASDEPIKTETEEVPSGPQLPTEFRFFYVTGIVAVIFAICTLVIWLGGHGDSSGYPPYYP